jgi:hypothetical protein
MQKYNQRICPGYLLDNFDGFQEANNLENAQDFHSTKKPLVTAESDVGFICYTRLFTKGIFLL